jgi:hypothetical protein
MKPQLQKHRTNHPLLILVGLFVITSFLIGITISDVSSQLGRWSSTVLFIVTISLIGNIVGLLYACLAHVLTSNPEPVHKNDYVNLCSVGTLQCIVCMVSELKTYDPFETFLVLSVFATWNLYLSACIFQRDFFKRSSSVKFLSYFAAVLWISAVALLTPFRNWISPHWTMGLAPMFQSLISLGILVGGTAIVQFEPNSSLRKSISIQRFRSYLRTGGKHGSDVTNYFLMTLWCAATPLICTLVVRLMSTDYTQVWPIYGISIGFPYVIAFSFRTIRNKSHHIKELMVSSRLAGPTAEKFLKKTIQDAPAWAASVGLRTCVFTIDHDPEDIVARAAPMTLQQIRNDEIGRCLHTMLNGRNLHLQSFGSKVTGAINPELSPRPVTESIKILTAMHLDATPLIERRINGLYTLLPIINPGLATALRSVSVPDTLKKSQFFFYVDYRWVDQNIVNTPQSARYAVHADSISHGLKNLMLQHMKKSNAIGTYLWLTKDAHTRFLQEAPMMAPVVETVSLKLPDGSDQVFFTLKFETLIPRLQRFYELDAIRNHITDFEVSKEASRLLGIFRSQMQSFTDPKDVQQLVETIAGTPWRGFKEKDQALRLIVMAYQFTDRIVQDGVPLSESTTKSLSSLQRLIHDAIETIGYPAQIIHAAQVHKLAIRDMQSLLLAASDSNHKRFEESWTLLGTLDFSRYTRADRKLIANFLNPSQSTMKALLSFPLTQLKYMDAVVNLAKTESEIKDYTFGIDQFFNGLISILSQIETSSEVLSLILDAATYLGQLSGKDPIMGQPDLVNDLDHLIENLAAKNQAFSSGLGNRWIERKQRYGLRQKAS